MAFINWYSVRHSEVYYCYSFIYHLSFFWRTFVHILRYSKFQSIANITLHFPESFGGDTTQILYIGFKGEATQVKFISKSPLHCHLCLHCSNSLCLAMNSWRGMLLQQLSMSSCQILQITSKVSISRFSSDILMSSLRTLFALCLRAFFALVFRMYESPSC